jgi:hypothetical protein
MNNYDAVMQNFNDRVNLLREREWTKRKHERLVREELVAQSAGGYKRATSRVGLTERENAAGRLMRNARSSISVADAFNASYIV